MNVVRYLTLLVYKGSVDCQWEEGHNLVSFSSLRIELNLSLLSMFG